MFSTESFKLTNQVAIVTGGTGVLGGAMARGLAQAGARVVILGRRATIADEVAASIRAAGGEALGVGADVLEQAQLEAARDLALERWGRIDILLNAAGGNMPGATVAPDASLFGLQPDAFRAVVDLNLTGTLIPSLVFGATMAQKPEPRGCIINISSMAAQLALTRVGGYSAAKAGVDNLTRWLAVELARRYGEGMRVNAIAPGFFVGEQNRALLLQPDGTPTERGKSILAHTPAGRFGNPDDLLGALIWLCSPAAAFINGVVIPVDGGFSAFSGI